MIYQPMNIIPDEINGTGCVDATDNFEVSFSFEGSDPLVAIKATFYSVDGTELGSRTGTLAAPVWGRNEKGELRRLTATLSNSLTSIGMYNGNEYRYVLTLYWDTTQGAEQYVLQRTASVIICRNKPVLTIDSFTDPITSREHTFTATYTQAQGDAINSIHWLIAEEGSEDDPIYDSGLIYGTGDLEVTYDGFFTGVKYGIRCIITTQYDVTADTGWQYFDVLYQIDTSTGTASACQLASENAIFVSWTQIPNAYGYYVMRQTVGENKLKKVAEVDTTVGQIRDFSAHSGETYKYYIYPTGQTSFLTGPQVTNEITAKYRFWAIMEAALRTDNESYYVINAYYFRYGDGGVKEADISNNNLPTILKSFTRYPTRQGTNSNYRSGSISGYVGSFAALTREYSDTVKTVDEIMALSTSENILFLTDPKGRFMRIHSNAEITVKTDIKKAVMPQTLTFPWVEVGSADDLVLISEPGHQFYPADAIINTTLAINRSSGALLWTVPNDYNYGSRLSISNGSLIQTIDGAFTAATLDIDSDYNLVATIDEEET